MAVYQQPVNVGTQWIQPSATDATSLIQSVVGAPITLPADTTTTIEPRQDLDGLLRQSEHFLLKQFSEMEKVYHSQTQKMVDEIKMRQLEINDRLDESAAHPQAAGGKDRSADKTEEPKYSWKEVLMGILTLLTFLTLITFFAMWARSGGVKNLRKQKMRRMDKASGTPASTQPAMAVPSPPSSTNQGGNADVLNFIKEMAAKNRVAS